MLGAGQLGLKQRKKPHGANPPSRESLVGVPAAAAAAAQLRGKTEAPPAKGALPPSQRASLWRSTARSRRRSSVHAGAQRAKDGIDRTGNSVVGSADGVFREEFS